MRGRPLLQAQFAGLLQQGTRNPVWRMPSSGKVKKMPLNTW